MGVNWIPTPRAPRKKSAVIFSQAEAVDCLLGYVRGMMTVIGGELDADQENELRAIREAFERTDERLIYVDHELQFLRVKVDK